MKSLVVFYSRTGRTRKIAERIASRLQSEKEEIIDRKKRRGFVAWFVAGADAVRKKLTEIEGIKKDPSSFDVVILGTPVWGDSMVPALRTYITQFRDKIKRVAFFYCSGGTEGSQKIFPDMEELTGRKPVATVHFGVSEIGKKDFPDKIKKFSDDVRKTVK
ncbi:MAG: flavodoxin domain-containing protein [bacterium]|nr:flavodoxin domain-containing protein [bacterium]